MCDRRPHQLDRSFAECRLTTAIGCFSSIAKAAGSLELEHRKFRFREFESSTVVMEKHIDSGDRTFSAIPPHVVRATETELPSATAKTVPDASSSQPAM
uniref:Uncharacterized protein n=1 Tax=Setaria viridis TaxID=4556 RepID=A0A4U6VL76_SETVI|nr:hypothetical protein SEVIR_3G404600v2 [Setaria viridis]